MSSHQNQVKSYAYIILSLAYNNTKSINSSFFLNLILKQANSYKNVQPNQLFLTHRNNPLYHSCWVLLWLLRLSMQTKSSKKKNPENHKVLEDIDFATMMIAEANMVRKSFSL